jgi:hypothetical protein
MAGVSSINSIGKSVAYRATILTKVPFPPSTERPSYAKGDKMAHRPLTPDELAAANVAQTTRKRLNKRDASAAAAAITCKAKLVGVVRRLSVYDGSERLGRIEISKDGAARAFDARGRRLGTFPNFKAAADAFKHGDANAA